MSVAGLVDLPLEIFSGLITDLAPATLPPGASPAQSDFAFILGAALTRPGLGAGVAGLGPFFPANATINYLKTYTDQQGNNRLLFLDSTGNLRQEYPQGTVVVLNPLQDAPPNAYADSITLFGREYIAFSQNAYGIDIPRQFDGTNYDRVSQVGPGAGPVSAADVSYPLTAISRTSGVITGTGPGQPQGLFAGGLVSIAGVNEDNTFNGTFPIATADSGGFTAWGNPGTFSINGIDRVGGTVTADLENAGGLTVSQQIIVGDVQDASFNGLFTISAINGNQVSWAQAEPNTSSVGGTLYAQEVTTPILDIFAIGIGSTTCNVALQGIATGYIPGGTVTIQNCSVSGWNGDHTIGSVTVNSDGNTIVEFVMASPPADLGTNGQAFPTLPDSSPTVTGVAGPAGGITIGVHQLVVIFVTRQGYLTMPSPAISWAAAGGFQVLISGLPQAPFDPNVIARIVAMTAADGATFFYTLGLNGTANMSVPDAATTNTLQFGITDTALLSGEPAANLFNLLELGECAGVLGYSSRTFWWGERNKVQNFLNLSFDGGTATDASQTPLGWTLDPTSGAGGASAASNIWNGAWEITGDGATAIRGMITQPAYTDQFGAQIILPNTAYSARIRIARTGGTVWANGNIEVELYSVTSGGSLGRFTVPSSRIPPHAVSGPFFEFIGSLTPSFSVVPSDLMLRAYADGTPTAGASLVIDNIELFPTLQPFNSTIVRSSYAEDPESFDGLTGFMNFNTQNNQPVRSMFVLREKLYAVKQGSLYETEDDGQNEPSAWSITEISNKVGTPSVGGVDVGEEWAMIAARQGLYIFWGPEPVKVSQEIQSVWNSINWNAGSTIWVKVDDVNKRTLVGVPINGATSPNRVLLFDYRGLDTAQEIADHWTVRYSSYTGKILAIGNSPKWSPWTMAINSCALIERNDGNAHTFMGNGAGTGKVYDLLDPQQPGSGGVYNDDGAGIPWTYSTYFVPGHTDEQQLHLGAHRKLFGYLTGLVEGSGQMDITMQPIGNAPPVQVPPIELVNVGAPAVVTQQSRQQGTVIITCAAGHGLQPTDTQVVLANMEDSSLNGIFPIAEILNATEFVIFQVGLDDLPNLGAGGTVTRCLRDFEFGTNVEAERVSYTFSNHANTPNTWVKLQKVIPSMSIAPWAPVRGGN